MIDKEKIKKWVKQDLIVKGVFKEEGWSLKSIEAEVAIDRAIDLTIEKTLQELEAKNGIGGNLSGGGSTPPASTSEEWSLKGKEWIELGVGTFTKRIRKMCNEDIVNETTSLFYPKDDIETLRQKLIEDFIGFVDYIGENPEDFADAAKKHIEIINKRFGVKHG